MVNCLEKHPNKVSRDLYIRDPLKYRQDLSTTLVTFVWFVHDAIGYSTAIAIRKEPVENALRTLLKHTVALPDVALFAASVITQGDLLLISEALSFRRIHRTNISLSLAPSNRKYVRYFWGLDSKIFMAATKGSAFSSIHRWMYLANLSEYMAFPTSIDSDPPKLRPGLDELVNLLSLLRDRSFSSINHVLQIAGMAINFVITFAPDPCKANYIKFRYRLTQKGFPAP